MKRGKTQRQQSALNGDQSPKMADGTKSPPMAKAPATQPEG
jgi:hypothetical protein